MENLCEAMFVSHDVADPNDKYNIMMIIALPVQILAKVKDIINAG